LSIPPSRREVELHPIAVDVGVLVVESGIRGVSCAEHHLGLLDRDLDLEMPLRRAERYGGTRRASLLPTLLRSPVCPLTEVEHERRAAGANAQRLQWCDQRLASVACRGPAHGAPSAEIDRAAGASDVQGGRPPCLPSRVLVTLMVSTMNHHRAISFDDIRDRPTPAPHTRYAAFTPFHPYE
jgi:hypothetical protein